VGLEPISWMNKDRWICMHSVRWTTRWCWFSYV